MAIRILSINDDLALNLMAVETQMEQIQEMYGIHCWLTGNAVDLLTG